MVDSCPLHEIPLVKDEKVFSVGDCRICWTVLNSGAGLISDYKQKISDAPNKKAVCEYRGDSIPAVELKKMGLTHLRIWYECEKGHGPQCACNRSCGPSCKDFKPIGDECEVKKAKAVMPPNANYPSVGVSIGSYGMPGTIELQAATIRANCGDIPIMVSDDHTEEAGDDGLSKKLRILDICEKYGLIYRDTAPERVGHAGGDLGSFHHGLTYAHSKGIEYWLKLSQRFIVDRPLFVQKCAAIMRDQQHHTMSQTHKNRGKFFFAMRTEFVLHDVKRWFRPDIMEILRPRPLGRAAEDVVHSCVKILGGAIMACPLFTPERSKAHAGLVWYEQPNSDEAYLALAEKYNVELGKGFHCGGSVHSPGFRWG